MNRQMIRIILVTFIATAAAYLPTYAWADTLWTCAPKSSNLSRLHGVSIGHIGKSLLLSAKLIESGEERGTVLRRSIPVEQADQLQMLGAVDDKQPILVFVGEGFAMSVETQLKEEDGTVPGLLTWSSNGRSETTEVSCRPEL